MKNIYTCSFCGKKEEGKPITYLIHQKDRDKVKFDGTNVALKPYGWDWDIQEITFDNLWSCGCTKIN